MLSVVVVCLLLLSVVVCFDVGKKFKEVSTGSRKELAERGKVKTSIIQVP